MSSVCREGGGVDKIGCSNDHLREILSMTGTRVRGAHRVLTLVMCIFTSKVLFDFQRPFLIYGGPKSDQIIRILRLLNLTCG